MRRFLIIALVIGGISGYCQDTTSVEYLFHKFRQNLSNSDSARYFSEKAIELAGIHNDSIALARALGYKGWVQLNTGEVKNSLATFKSALKITRLTSNLEREAIILNQMVLAFKNLGNLDSALHYSFLSLEKRKSLGDSLMISAAFNNLGSIYTDLENYHDAIFNFSQAIKYLDQSEGNESRIDAYANITSCYISLRDYERAKYYLNKVKYLCSTSCSDNSKKLLTHLTGIIHYRNGDYIKAIEFLDSAILLSQKLNDNYFLCYSYLFLAKANYRLGNIPVFLDNIEIANEIAVEAKYIHIQAFVYRDLYEYYSKEQDSNQALFFLEKAVAIEDSTQNNRTFWNIDKIHSEQLSKKNEEILQQKEQIIAQTEKSNQLLKISGGLLGGMLMGMFWVVYMVRRKNRIISRQNKELDLYTEKLLKGLDAREMELQSTREAIDRIISRVSHDVRGKVATLKLLSYLAEKETEQDDGYYSKIIDTIRDTDTTLAWITVFSRIKNAKLNPVKIHLKEFINSELPEVKIKGEEIDINCDRELLFNILEAIDEEKKVQSVRLITVDQIIRILINTDKRWSREEYKKWLKYINGPEDINADVTENLILNRAAMERLGGQISLNRDPDTRKPVIILELPIGSFEEEEKKIPAIGETALRPK